MSNIENVTIQLKANVYFDGKVISHSLVTMDGSKQSVGVIMAGSYSFNTEAAERMDIIAGTCKVKVAGQSEWTTYQTGTGFDVPGHSSFEITVEKGITEYLCSYL